MKPFFFGFPFLHFTLGNEVDNMFDKLKYYGLTLFIDNLYNII